MSSYRIKVTNAGKLWGARWVNNPELVVFTVQERFWGFFWHDLCHGHSEMWARASVAKRKQLDVKQKVAAQQPDYFIEVDND